MNIPCYGTYRANLAAEGLTLAQECEIEDAITRHEAMQALFSWACEHDPEMAERAYLEAGEIEGGVFIKYHIQEYTPIEELEAQAELGLVMADPEIIRLMEEDKQRTFDEVVKQWEANNR